MNKQQIEQVAKIKYGFSKNIQELYASILLAYRLITDMLHMGIDWDSATVDRIQENATDEFTTFKKNLRKINPHGFRERTFGISKKRKQEIPTYIHDLTVSIANITRLKKEIKEIIDSIRPHADDDSDDDDQTYLGDSSSYRNSSSSSSSSSSSPIYSPNYGPRSSPRSSSRSSSRSTLFFGPSSSSRSSSRSSPRSSPRLSAGGGKKSKKRRRQSKQTKRRQHKINKQPKLKYTIRRR